MAGSTGGVPLTRIETVCYKEPAVLLVVQLCPTEPQDTHHVDGGRHRSYSVSRASSGQLVAFISHLCVSLQDRPELYGPGLKYISMRHNRHADFSVLQRVQKVSNILGY